MVKASALGEHGGVKWLGTKRPKGEFRDEFLRRSSQRDADAQVQMQKGPGQIQGLVRCDGAGDPKVNAFPVKRIELVVCRYHSDNVLSGPGVEPVAG